MSQIPALFKRKTKRQTAKNVKQLTGADLQVQIQVNKALLSYMEEQLQIMHFKAGQLWNLCIPGNKESESRFIELNYVKDTIRSVQQRRNRLAKIQNKLKSLV